MKRYLVVGGYVWSKSRDGDRHFIDAYTLTRLYGVNPAECIMTRSGEESVAMCGLSPTDRSRLIRLFPRYDGDYSGLHPTSIA